MEIYRKFVSQINSTIQNLSAEFDKESDSELKEMYLYAVQSGRRYRPTLLLTGKLIGDDIYGKKSIELAIAIELIHKYSLILDDSVDSDPLRRGQITYYQKYGRNNAQAMSAYIINLNYSPITDDCRLEAA